MIEPLSAWLRLAVIHTPAYHNIGELHFTDEKDIPIVILCYVQEETIKGHDKFALICNDTLVDVDTDVNYVRNLLYNLILVRSIVLR